MGKLTVGNTVRVLPESKTWVHQYGLTGVITEIFHKDNSYFATISVPKWLIKRKGGGYIISEWIRNGWSKPEEDFLLLDEGIDLNHLELSEMPDPTIDEKVDALIDQAFGFKYKRLGINVIHYPKDLVVTDGICVCLGCDQPRTHLAWHNNHGTVEAFMVCEGHHKEFNGRCSDGFSLKSEFLHKIA